MDLMIWVFFALGDSTVAGEAPAYEQTEVSRIAHDYAAPHIEAEQLQAFHNKHPHHVICDSGWCQQKVRVNKP